jgi:hypothetical protein
MGLNKSGNLRCLKMQLSRIVNYYKIKKLQYDHRRLRVIVKVQLKNKNLPNSKTILITKTYYRLMIKKKNFKRDISIITNFFIFTS